MTALCRSCSRSFAVATTMEEFLVERLKDGTEHYHPKVDCNINEEPKDA